jgi:hypothetical protein
MTIEKKINPDWENSLNLYDSAIDIFTENSSQGLDLNGICNIGYK